MADTILTGPSGSGIYEILNTVNGKRYIGSAKYIGQRWREHRKRLEAGRHHSRYLQSAWNKYGAASFKFSVLDLCEVSSLIVREQSAFDSLKPEYNVCKRADSTLGRAHSPETRAKIRDMALGRKCAPRGPEYRAAISRAHKGKPKSETHMAALQAGRKRRVYTPEQRARISEGLRAGYITGKRSRSKSQDHCNKISKFFSKLSEHEVLEIRRLRAEGETLSVLSRQFKSPMSTISQIVRRQRYKWVA